MIYYITDEMLSQFRVKSSNLGDYILTHNTGILTFKTKDYGFCQIR